MGGYPPKTTNGMPEQDESLGKKILGFFIKPDDEQPGPATAVGSLPTQRAVPRPPVAETNAPATPTPVNAPTGTIDDKFARHLADVLAQNNPSGPDYFEFRETLRSLNNLGLTEDKQYQAAWASFKALSGNTDVNLLTGTANQYLTSLNKDRDGFGKSVEAALSERVGGLQNEQKRLQQENEALAKQLLDIQRQIDANANRLNAINGEVMEQSAKIEQNRQNYETTFAHFTSQIKADVENIKQYLT